MYYKAEVARVWAEMIRPDVAVAGEGAWGGYTYDLLMVAGLARHIQATLYLHTCTPNYCLKNHAACRFFYPWPEQPCQLYDEHPDRVALRRGLPSDDQWVVPRNLELMMFSRPASTSCLSIRSTARTRRGSTQARTRPSRSHTFGLKSKEIG